MSAPLTLKESVDILVQLTDIYPQTTLCIDAMDEINCATRIQLQEALKSMYLGTLQEPGEGFCNNADGPRHSAAIWDLPKD